MPLTLLAAAAYVWLLWELKRRSLAKRPVVYCPLDQLREPALAGCQERVRRINTWLAGIFPPEYWCWLLLACIFLPVGTLLWQTFQPLGEPKANGRLFVTALLIVAALGTVSFFRFVRLWFLLSGILQRFDHASPELVKALQDLAKEVEWQPMKSFGLPPAPFKMTFLSTRKLALLRNLGSLQAADPAPLLEALLEHEANGLTANENGLRGRLETIFDAACLNTRGRAMTREIREFLLVRFIAYLRYVFAHLRSSLIGAMGTGLLILLTVAAYFFEPKPFVSLAVWISLGIGVGLTLWIFLWIDRNPTLSRIGDTKPGEITFDKTFWLNFILYVAVPLLGVVATQFPEVGRLLGHVTDEMFRVAGGG